MKYRELVKRVQHYSGFSDQESEKALNTVIRRLAERLTPDERKDFASQLPSELQDTAMVEGKEQKYNAEEMLQIISQEENIDPARAKKQIHAVWESLKEAITPGEIDDIRTQMPKDLAAMLH